MSSDFLSKEITFLEGIGLDKAQLLKEELGIHTCKDLLEYYPFRYEDKKTLFTVSTIASAPASTGIPLQGYIRNVQKIGRGKKRLTAYFQDNTGQLELVWFQNFSWIIKKIKPNILYRVWGKPSFLPSGLTQLIHPEISLATDNPFDCLSPVYHTTEKLKKKQLGTIGIADLQKKILSQLGDSVVETLPFNLLDQYQLIALKAALKHIHFPSNQKMLWQAQRRLKFEELFYVQLKLLKVKQVRIEKQNSKVFKDLSLFHNFYHNYLSFNLTNDQKKVIRAIYRDLCSGKQMNRLLQGDVGSGKTIVAFLAALIAIGHQVQVAIMAPTEILAKQHYERFSVFAKQLNLPIALLTGSTKRKEREHIVYQLQVGLLPIIVGTHALLSNDVSFKELGFFIVDEQHRFGVAQRAGLLAKNQLYAPHILIMTATPIPRTLAMSFYGDLDVSTIHTLPDGRKPIQTKHYYEHFRSKVWQFLRKELASGKQVYIVYPLIEASAALDYHNLLMGYENIVSAFPDASVGMVHGKMDSASRESEMSRFERNETAILVATTVIEVGIHVPNATVMLIENADCFGLAQLHQLRGRVGRGDTQGYCILMTNHNLSKIGKARIDTMVKTNNGFEIAELDLKFRGPGDLMGLQQSGDLNFKIADLTTDISILEAARQSAKKIIKADPHFHSSDNLPIHRTYNKLLALSGSWGMIG
ncbi:MAG: ATP-dependent DNA helicase RecG [Candidatus Cardinium sp.]|nr:ATP-dependent DNA helicase RecG [Candidatus Cardinium sp.]